MMMVMVMMMMVVVLTVRLFGSKNILIRIVAHRPFISRNRRFFANQTDAFLNNRLFLLFWFARILFAFILLARILLAFILFAHL